MSVVDLVTACRVIRTGASAADPDCCAVNNGGAWVVYALCACQTTKRIGTSRWADRAQISLIKNRVKQSVVAQACLRRESLVSRHSNETHPPDEQYRDRQDPDNHTVEVDPSASAARSLLISTPRAV